MLRQLNFVLYRKEVKIHPKDFYPEVKIVGIRKIADIVRRNGDQIHIEGISFTLLSL